MTDADSVSSASPIIAVQSSPDISSESHSGSESGETPITKLTCAAGLLPAFEMLMTRLEEVGKRGEENETNKTMNQNEARALFSNTPGSRLALSTIQAYGSTESQPNLQSFSKPIFSRVSSTNNSQKRQRRSSSPVNRKKAKYGKLNSGVGHGIRKPKPQTKADKKQQDTLTSESSNSSGSSQLNLKLQAIKNKLNKNKAQSDAVKKLEPGINAETWEDNDEFSMELTEIVDNLNSCTDNSDNSNVKQEEGIFMQTEQEICKINELIHIVQGDGGKDFLPSSSPSRNFADLVPVDKEKIDEVEQLLYKLFSSDELISSNDEKPVCISEILSPQAKRKSSENVLDLPGDESDVSTITQNEMNISSASESPCIAFESPSHLSQESLQYMEDFVDKLNHSDYVDPDDSDPFGEYDEYGSSINSSDDKESNVQEFDISSNKDSIICDDGQNASPKTETSLDAKNLLQTYEHPKEKLEATKGSCANPLQEFDTNALEKNLGMKQSSMKQGASNSASKLFPVFIKEKMTNKIKELQKRSPKQPGSQIRCNFPVQEKDGKEQLLLDAGQKKFGLVVCEGCHFHYDPDVRKDVEAHFSYHNRHETHPKHMGWKNEHVVTDYQKDGRILMVKAGDPSSWWKRVSTILETVNYDLGFKEEKNISQNNSKVFLYVWEKNIVGCIVSEHISTANRMLPGLQDLCTEESFPALCGISRIWTSKTLRRKGFASKLMSAVRTNFLASRDLALTEIAFSSPTPDGRAFATKYLGTDTFLVY